MDSGDESFLQRQADVVNQIRTAMASIQRLTIDNIQEQLRRAMGFRLAARLNFSWDQEEYDAEQNKKNHSEEFPTSQDSNTSGARACGQKTVISGQ